MRERDGQCRASAAKQGMNCVMHIHATRFVRIATLVLACTAGGAMPQAGVAWVEFVLMGV